MKTCLRCGAALEQNPIHRHWHHCPRCEPQWIEAIRAYLHMHSLVAFASFAANDRRGRPTMGGVKA